MGVLGGEPPIKINILLLYMGYSNGLISQNIGTGKREKGDPGLPGIGFNFTDDDDDFDIDAKRLTDVADPVDDKDAATKKNMLMIMFQLMRPANLM